MVICGHPLHSVTCRRAIRAPSQRTAATYIQKVPNFLLSFVLCVSKCNPWTVSLILHCLYTLNYKLPSTACFTIVCYRLATLTGGTNIPRQSNISTSFSSFFCSRKPYYGVQIFHDRPHVNVRRRSRQKCWWSLGRLFSTACCLFWQSNLP